MSSDSCEAPRPKWRRREGYVQTFSMYYFQDEIAELRKRLKLTEHQLDQVKEEIVMREALLLKERMDKAVIEKEKESLMVNLPIFPWSVFYIHFKKWRCLIVFFSYCSCFLSVFWTIGMQQLLYNFWLPWVVKGGAINNERCLNTPGTINLFTDVHP